MADSDVVEEEDEGEAEVVDKFGACHYSINRLSVLMLHQYMTDKHRALSFRKILKAMQIDEILMIYVFSDVLSTISTYIVWNNITHS